MMNTKQKYEAAFKKRHCGTLIWLTCLASNENDATKKLKSMGETPGHRHKHNGYKLYGGSLLCQ